MRLQQLDDSDLLVVEGLGEIQILRIRRLVSCNVLENGTDTAEPGQLYRLILVGWLGHQRGHGFRKPLAIGSSTNCLRELVQILDE
jgi:hypothetical protein